MPPGAVAGAAVRRHVARSTASPASTSRSSRRASCVSDRAAWRRTAWSSSSSRSRTTSTCSVSPTAPRVRSACTRTRGSSPSTASRGARAGLADLALGRDLEAHLGRPPVLVVEAGDDRRARPSRPRRRAARGRPRCAPSSPSTARGSRSASPRRTTRPVRYGIASRWSLRGRRRAAASTQSSTTRRARRGGRPARSTSSPTGRLQVARRRQHGHVAIMPRYRAPMTSVRRERPARARPGLGRRGPRRPRPAPSSSGRRRGRGRRRPDRPGRPLRRDPGVRHGRPARRARRRPEPDEPGRRHPRRGRPGGVPHATPAPRRRRRS